MPKHLKVISAKKDTHQETGTPFIDVAVRLYDVDEAGEEVEGSGEVKKFGYAFGTTPKEIKADLEKVLSVTIQEEESRAMNAEVDALNKKADETISEVEKIEF